MLMRSAVTSSKRIPDHFGVLNDFDREALAPEVQSLTALLKSQKQVVFRPKDILFREGDPADNVFLIVTGTVCLYRFMPGGRRVIGRFLFEHDMAGISFGDEYPFTAECLSTTTAYKIARSRLDPLCAHSPSLQNDLVRMLKYELATERENHLPMMHQAADARVARLLRMLVRQNGGEEEDGTRIHLSMSRNDVADFLGLTIETVCRSIKKLKETGLISTSSPDQIRVENMHDLAMLADGEH